MVVSGPPRTDHEMESMEAYARNGYRFIGLSSYQNFLQRSTSSTFLQAIVSVGSTASAIREVTCLQDCLEIFSQNQTSPTPNVSALAASIEYLSPWRNISILHACADPGRGMNSAET